MPAPTITTADAIAAGASTITLALLGVDYYSLIWGMVGALLALYQAEKMGRVRSVIFISLSTLVGAACGTGALHTLESTSRPLLIVLSMVAGFGAQVIVTALLRAGLNRIDRLGGQ
jgi:hypothetical protein